MVNNILMKISKRNRLLIALVSIALISMLIVSRVVSAPSFNFATMKSLDDKKITVMKLAAVATATSATTSLILGERAAPIAEELTELSSYFIIILCVILMEKILLSVVGYVTFTFVIPCACGLGIFYLFTRKDALLHLSIKLAVFGMILFIAIPASMQISDLVYSSHQAVIEQTMVDAELNSETIQETESELSEGEKNWMGQVGDYLGNIGSTIGNGLSSITEKAENSLSMLLDAVVVLIVTSCVIPIGVLLIFAFIIKSLVKAASPSSKGSGRMAPANQWGA